MDRWLAIAAFLFSCSSALHSGWQLARGEFHRRYFNLIALGSAWLLLFGVLAIRGKIEGGCPLIGPADLLLFLSWGILGFYLTAGRALRMSLIGYFTAPLAAILQGAALMPGVWETAVANHHTRSALIEAHASLSMLAYAGFALAAIAGIMFLVLDSQLKRKEVRALGWKLPPLHHLNDALVQLVIWSLVLLSAGLVMGFLEWHFKLSPKIISAIFIWLIFSIALILRQIGVLHSRRFAQTVVGGFLLALISLWLIERALPANEPEPVESPHPIAESAAA